MDTDWTAFKGRQFGSRARNEIRVTVSAKGTIYLNNRAYEALGMPPAVELLIDPNATKIGLRVTDPTFENAFAVKPHGTTGRYKRIAASAFFQHYRIKLQFTRMFHRPDLDRHEVLVLDLTTAVNISRGAR